MGLGASAGRCCWRLCAPLSVANGCGGSDYDLKARAIAERWSENNGEVVAREMAGLLVDDAPGVASLGSDTLARQIRNGIGWRYGEPSCDRDGGCKLTATATSEINISVPFVVSKTVMVELPFSAGNRRPGGGGQRRGDGDGGASVWGGGDRRAVVRMAVLAGVISGCWTRFATSGLARTGMGVKWAGDEN